MKLYFAAVFLSLSAFSYVTNAQEAESAPVPAKKDPAVIKALKSGGNTTVKKSGAKCVFVTGR